MKNKFLPLALLAAAIVLQRTALADQPAPASVAPVRTVVIIGDDTLRFNITTIEAKPGEPIHVQLRNEGTLPKDGMGHNWILLDSDNEAVTYAMAAIPAREFDYMPKAEASHVLASIPLLGPKEVGDVTFTAPTKPGKYPYICSCSGHSMAGMRGELVVK